LLEICEHWANTGKETLSAFIDSSIENVLLHANPDFASHLLNSKIFLNVILADTLHYNSQIL